jgi:tRNA(Ser,Leu) C12 N-acetylase TAN1
MRDWNVVISVYEGRFARACQILEQFGRIERTEYYNVLVMKVEDVSAFVSALAELVSIVPDVLAVVSRAMPAAVTFTFQSAQEFETKARDAALGWLPALAGKAFHVRLHRRGFRGRLSSQEEERFLDEALLEALERAGTPGRVSFDDPDAILDVETVSNRAGLSLWSREDLSRLPFLKLD